MAIYDVNYDDKRFKDVENEKQSELNKYNETYDNLINERNKFTKSFSCHGALHFWLLGG